MFLTIFLKHEELLQNHVEGTSPFDDPPLSERRVSNRGEGASPFDDSPLSERRISNRGEGAEPLHLAPPLLGEGAGGEG